MDFSDASSWFFVPLQIMFVDLLLGADNALLIALACRALPPAQVKQAAAIGVIGAIFMRLLLATVATALLLLPVVKLLGAVALFLIAMNMAAGDDLAEGENAHVSPASSLFSAAAVILVADLAMSLDNVVALAAIAAGNLIWIAIGVALSIPVLAFGGVALAGALHRAPYLVIFGAAMLGWIAGGMAMTDPLVFPWADANAPGLVALAPAFGAAFIYLYGRFVAPMRRGEAIEAPPKPAPPLASRELAPPIVSTRAEPKVQAAEPAQISPLPLARPAPPEPRAQALPEPVDVQQPGSAPASRDDRVAIIALLALAVIAGAFLLIVSYFDAFD